jgi:hypothetical protein
VTGVVVLSVPREDVQCMILVPWEGIALRSILVPLVCHYRAVVGNCPSSKNLYFDFVFLQVILGLDILELFVGKESLFD